MTETVNELSFEEAFQGLQATVQSLETGDLTLAESLAVFRQGVDLANRCDTLLDDAELQVRQVVTDGAGGYEAVSFDAWQGERRE